MAVQTIRILGEHRTIDPDRCKYGPGNNSASQCTNCAITGRLPCTAPPKAVPEPEFTERDGKRVRRCQAQLSIDCEGYFPVEGNRKYCFICAEEANRFRFKRHWRNKI